MGVSYRDAILNYRRAIHGVISILGKEMFHDQRMKPILSLFSHALHTFLVKYLQLCTHISLRNMQESKYLNTTLSNFYLNNIKLHSFREAKCDL